MGELLEKSPASNQLNHGLVLKLYTEFQLFPIPLIFSTPALSPNCNLSQNDGLAELRELIYTPNRFRENTQYSSYLVIVS